MGNIYTHIICLLVGALIMYWLKDNYAKSDIDIDLTIKKNKLGNIRNRFKRKEKV